MTAQRFVPAVTVDDLRREKARARELRRTAWWKRRLSAGCCHYCSRRVGGRALTMDHLVPIIRGGRSIRPNLVPSCRDCNARKQSSLAWEWEGYAPRREGVPEE
jgi:5-methylcytosine-specific restriction protein A